MNGHNHSATTPIITTDIDADENDVYSHHNEHDVSLGYTHSGEAFLSLSGGIDLLLFIVLPDFRDMLLPGIEPWISYTTGRLLTPLLNSLIIIKP